MAKGKKNIKKKRKVNIIVLIVIVLFIISFVSVIIFNHNSIVGDKALNKIEDYIYVLNSYTNKYPIGTSGIMDITANYRGAHGENYPGNFTYNYELSDKLYFEDKTYNYLELDDKLINIFKVIKNIGKIDVNEYKIKSSKSDVIEYIYDNKKINKKLNTKFKNVRLKVITKGIYKKIDRIEIVLDDILIKVKDKDINITKDNNDIDLIINKDSVYLGINGNLKCNLFTKDDMYTFSTVLNNSVYYFELKKDGMYIKFNNSSAIYNSIDINVKYEEVKLKKKKKTSNFDDNPIIRYLSKSDLNIWR